MVTVSDVRYFEHTDDDIPVTNKALGGTTVSPFIVPPGMTHIIGLAPQYSADGATVSASGAIMSLSGDALKGTSTPLRFPAGAFGSTLATTHSTPARSGYIPTSIPVKAGDTIDATSTMVGVDTGTSVSQLEIEYSDMPRPGFPRTMTYKALEVIAAGVDTEAELEDGGAAKKFNMASADKFIRQLITAVISDSSATGGQCSALTFTGNGIDQDQSFCLDGSGGTHATEGNGHAEARVRNIMAKVHGNQPITAKVISSGVTTGNVIFIVGIGIAES